jgi:hypothetical protein
MFLVVNYEIFSTEDHFSICDTFYLCIRLVLLVFQDVYKIKMCPKSGKRCSGDCSDHEVYMRCNGTEIIPGQGISPIHLQLQGAEWFKVTKVEEIFEIFDKVGDVSYRIVAGNTGQGKEY